MNNIYWFFFIWLLYVWNFELKGKRLYKYNNVYIIIKINKLKKDISFEYLVICISELLMNEVLYILLEFFFVKLKLKIYM